MLAGKESPPWKCLGGSKFLYVNAAGEVQFVVKIARVRPCWMTCADLRANNRHKAYEPGCVIGCVRQVSHALGEPLKTLKTSLGLVAGIRAPAKSITHS